MANLCAGICSSLLVEKGAGYRGFARHRPRSTPRVGWQLCRGISGSFRLEWVAGLLWNQWQLWRGTGGSFAAESVAGFTWNRWQLWRGIRRGRSKSAMGASGLTSARSWSARKGSLINRYRGMDRASGTMTSMGAWPVVACWAAWAANGLPTRMDQRGHPNRYAVQHISVQMRTRVQYPRPPHKSVVTGLNHFSLTAYGLHHPCLRSDSPGFSGKIS